MKNSNSGYGLTKLHRVGAHNEVKTVELMLKFIRIKLWLSVCKLSTKIDTALALRPSSSVMLPFYQLYTLKMHKTFVIGHHDSDVVP